MSTIQEYSFIGKGMVILIDGAVEHAMGNCSSLSFKLSIDEKKLANYKTAGGGNQNTVYRINDITAEMDLRELSPENLALATSGGYSVDNATGVASIEALTQVGKEYSLRFEGLNEAQSGASVTVEVYRLKVSPADSLDLIGDDFSTLKVKGAILADSSKPAGKSQYFKIEMDTKV
ncbi:hypothetical protein [Aquitalea magnusonii]|uniref:Phage tail protein n=1 Tax=Aquitalea magnusonii TaxID=332411 RepID=A0A318JVJ1_9NEIS|nr:hypothetical protein [Aquitalea magnusonii]PXX49000.1 hypothetical protein DFR38_10536 [Aquitalea magnusonii]